MLLAQLSRRGLHAEAVQEGAALRDGGAFDGPKLDAARAQEAAGAYIDSLCAVGRAVSGAFAHVGAAWPRQGGL